MEVTLKDVKAQTPGELLRALFAAIAARDADALERLWHDDVVEDFVVLGAVRGRARARAVFEELFAAVPDLVFETGRVVESGDVAVGQWVLRGTFDGKPFQNIDPTGKRVELRGVDVMEFENGLLRRNTIYYDGLTFARQIGLLPAQGTPGDRALLAGFNILTGARQRLRRLVRGTRR